MSFLGWRLQSQTQFPCVGWCLGWAGVWIVAASFAGLSKPTGTPLVFGCGPELASPCVCGTVADEVASVGTMPCCSGFVSPTAWFTGWTAPAGRFVSTGGMYTPSWPILAAIWSREERKDTVRGEGGVTIGSSVGSLSSLSRLFEQAERQIKILAVLPRVPLS